MKRIVPAVLIALLALAGGLAPLHAGVDIFMKVTGITGESNDVNHRGWIDVTSFTHGLSNSSAASGGAGGGGSSKVAHASFDVSKYLDKSSLPLNLKVNQGSHVDSVIVEFQTTGANKSIFYRVTMTDVVIVNTNIKGETGDSRITDGISMVYKKIVWEYWPIDSNGKLGPVVRTEWDVSANAGG